MSADRDLTPMLRDWLAEGPTELPEHVFDAVISELPTTRQAGRGPLAGWEVKRIAGVALIAASLAALAVVGLNVLGGRNIGMPEPAEPRDLAREWGFIDPGTYRVGDPFPMSATFDVRGEGWEVFVVGEDLAGVCIGDCDFGPQAALGFWVPSGIFSNPCDSRDGVLPDLVTASEMAAALADQPGAQGPPRRTAIGGWPAWRVDFVGPEDQDTCFGQEIRRFRSETNWIRGSAPGLRDAIWVVEYPGGPFIVSAYSAVDAPAEVVADLEAAVDSIRILGGRTDPVTHQLDERRSGPLEPGTYQLGDESAARPDGAEWVPQVCSPLDSTCAEPWFPVSIALTMPEGWRLYSAGDVATGIVRGSSPDQNVGIIFWALDAPTLYADGCNWRDTAIASPEGLNARDFVAALATPDRTIRAPEPVTLGALSGWAVELGPPGVDFATCDLGEFRNWTDLHAGAANTVTPDQERLLVFDHPDGFLFVVNPWWLAGTDPETVAEIDAILASLEHRP